MTEPAASDNFREQWLRTVDLIEAGIAARQHIGAQVSISRQGQVLADFALGESRPGVPMNPETVMVWLSAGKPIAAVAVARLWERGDVELDAPVTTYLPKFGRGGKAAITLRHLLTHTGGFRNVRLEDWPQTPWDQIIARICAAEIESGWIPGKRAGYHVASSWFILGEVIRRVDGRPYPQFVREEIFEPLGMNDSWIGMPRETYLAYGERIGVLQNTERGTLSPHTFSSE